MLSAGATFKLIDGDLIEKQGRRRALVATNVVSMETVNRRTIEFVEQNGNVYEKTANGSPVLIHRGNPNPSPNPIPNPSPNPNPNPNPDPSPNLNPDPNPIPDPNPTPAPNPNPNPMPSPDPGPAPIDDWFNQNLTNSGIGNLARSEFTRDRGITFGDMESLFEEVVQSGAITTSEVQDLATIVNNAAGLNMPAYVADLASKVLEPSSADVAFVDWCYSNWTPMPLMQKLVEQWFEGTALPTAVDSDEGSPAMDPANMWSAAGATGHTLFGPNGPSYTDVAQGSAGDCWLLASLAETAARDPQAIENMFVSNGNGTWTVRFYVGSKTDYVTVNDQLPVASANPSYNGGFAFDEPQNGVLWVALAEKAFVQENLSGQIDTAQPGVASYTALNGNFPAVALAAITGQSTDEFNLTPGMSAQEIAAALQAGDLVCIGSDSSGINSELVPDHCYAVIGYNPSSSMPFEVFNPWGVRTSNMTNGQTYGTFIANGAFLEENFDTWGVSGASLSGSATRTPIFGADAQLHGNGTPPPGTLDYYSQLGYPTGLRTSVATRKNATNSSIEQRIMRGLVAIASRQSVAHRDLALASIVDEDVAFWRS